MIHPRDLSVTKKLTGMVAAAASVALLMACTGFTLFELRNYRYSAEKELATIAQMIAGISTAALAFHDAKAAQETLATLRKEERIEAACIYTASGLQLAVYQRAHHPTAPPERPGSDGIAFSDTHMHVFLPVTLERERVGTVYIRSDLRDVRARLMRYAGITLAVLIVSLLAAVVVSSILQRAISGPILQLAAAARQVSRDGDYSLRVHRTDRDEIGTLFDSFNGMLTQIHARDVALQAARDELEDRVDERTRQLQSEVAERKSIAKDLIAAKEAAEASNRAKSVFLANMSHELRTPLNAIIGYSEMIEEDTDSACEETIADLRKIQGAGRHLLALINDVLDLSKIEAGRMDVHVDCLEVGKLLDEAVSTSRPLLRNNGNRMVVSCSDRNLEMQADAIKFRQALLNLLSNASKFTENGTITVSVSRVETEDGRCWVDWAVSDTGIGIAPEHMDKLFRSFSQVDGSATRRHGGTGLGLAISQRLCQMMGGTIWAQSVLHEGTTFTIRIPLASAETGRRTGEGLSRLADRLTAHKPQTSR